MSRLIQRIFALLALLVGIVASPEVASAQQGNYCAECEVDGCAPGYDLITSLPAGAYFWPHGSYCSSNGCPSIGAHCHGTDDEATADAGTVLTLVMNAFDQGNDQALSDLMTWLPFRVRLNEERMAIQVLSCDVERVVAHLPVSSTLFDKLLASTRMAKTLSRSLLR